MRKNNFNSISCIIAYLKLNYIDKNMFFIKKQPDFLNMLKGREITLRPILESDLGAFYLCLQSANLYISFPYGDVTSFYKFRQKFAATGFWEEEMGSILIVDEQGSILGMICYFKVNNRDALEISYILFDPQNQGKGIMTEALCLFSGYLFAVKKNPRLQISIPDYHRASIAVAKKCGFIFEGIARKAFFHKGKYIDICQYSMLKEKCKHLEKM